MFLPVRWIGKLQTVVFICLFETGVDPWCFPAISMTILIVKIWIFVLKILQLYKIDMLDGAIPLTLVQNASYNNNLPIL